MGKDTRHQKTGSGRVPKAITSRLFSSGGVVFKKVDDKVLWFVRQTVTSDLYPTKHWMLPKGWIDNKTHDTPGPMASGNVKADEKSLQETAIREVREEGGIEAKIIKKIGTSFFTYNDKQFGKVLKFVTFYLMEYIKDLPEGHDEETSEIRWLPFEEAKKLLSFGGEKEMLKKANEMLASLA